MLKLYPSEEFREIHLEIPPADNQRLAVSNYGRLIGFTHSMAEGKLLKPRMVNKYQMYGYSFDPENKRKLKFFCYYRKIAELFLERPSPEHIKVLHLDHDRGNDHLSNLKWATHQEMVDHHATSPHVIKAKEEKKIPKIRDGHKLTVTEVIRLKKRIFDPNRKTRYKILAKQFGISEMQLYRIKSGENWSNVQI